VGNPHDGQHTIIGQGFDQGAGVAAAGGERPPLARAAPLLLFGDAQEDQYRAFHVEHHCRRCGANAAAQDGPGMVWSLSAMMNESRSNPEVALAATGTRVGEVTAIEVRNAAVT
jgi:hypothetical protein